MARILLTGASGFVGRHVLRSLLARGDEVRIVGRTPTTLGSRVQELISEDLFAESDDWLTHACEGIDSIVHCAWYAEPGRYLFSPRNLTCLRGTLALAAAAQAAGIRRFVGIGTCFEYALSDSPLQTSTSLDPRSPYAAAKAAAFLALSGYLPNVGITFAWCRLFYLFGEGEHPQRFVAYLHERLGKGEPVDLTKGMQVRDFMDVAEAAERIAAITHSRYVGPANVCSGQPVSIRTMAERIADSYGRRDLLRFGTRQENAVDPPVIVGEPTNVVEDD
jgi:dTDP-6-deoxy-L-talose 4-dehydrogenase (NAD+)